ncbi:hypothetical protein BJ138DRAFT_1133448 [Hygrophoropsis aurantiaca]|uniref:Uncharacterized protein n=1 Tax=Hygrophoropsis aurantiaca TaxID=72124 RepID=A0ACB8ALD1_9AGAM|nr:hypothetical protein BJ138DRAFT_1133448 [Hygrophoropsis aurantiaca]
MWKTLLSSSILVSCILETIAAPPQAVLDVFSPRLNGRLHGRFLHISDMHPDPHYKSGASQSSACHRKKPKKEQRSGYYGTPFSECDSPFTLTNFTLDFLDEHWSDEIDFVICLHDNDDEIPRTLDEIYDLNRAVAKRMEEVFLNKGIPVVPSLGNNDISRPNDIIDEFSLIWDRFIPPASHTIFRQGAYYSVEVIPNAIAVISVNTMYFFNSNKGHVPPSSDTYFSECHYRYTELSLRFQDIILGHLFGHMNADHFFFIEAGDLVIPSHEESASIDSASNTNLFENLITDFAQLPTPFKDLSYDDYAVVNVNPSVVPNPYLPSFRVFAYNVTEISSLIQKGDADKEGIKIAAQRKSNYHHGNPGNEASECSTGPYRDSWRCRLGEPWHSDSEAPSRRNTLWSPLGYAQYYLPKLDEFDERHEPEFELEYLTFPITSLHGGDEGTAAMPPIPLRNLPKGLLKTGVTESKFAPYEMKDLTIPSWIDLAQRLGKKGEKKLRKRFRRYMYMGGEAGEE